MYQVMLQQILEHDVIYLYRHKNPDFDAIGSQHALKQIIELN